MLKRTFVSVFLLYLDSEDTYVFSKLLFPKSAFIMKTKSCHQLLQWRPACHLMQRLHCQRVFRFHYTMTCNTYISHPIVRHCHSVARNDSGTSTQSSYGALPGCILTLARAASAQCSKPTCLLLTVTR